MRTGNIIGRLVAVVVFALFSCGYAVGQDVQIQTVDYDVIRDIAYGPHPLQKFDIALPVPRPIDPCPVYVWFHGGAYVCGDKATPNPFLPRAAQAALALGCAVVAPNYRLAPESRWPSQLNDGVAVIKKILALADNLNLDAGRIAVCGHSAGAHLALMVGIQGPEVFGVAVNPIRAIINFSAFTDMTVQDSVIDEILHNVGVDKNDALEMSPALLLESDAPPILTFHGVDDPLILYNQATRLTRRMGLYGVRGGLIRVWGADHVYNPINPDIPIYPTRERMAVIANMFLREHMALGLLGDVNMDGVLDKDDLSAIFGTLGLVGYSVSDAGTVFPADPQLWNPLADINDDGAINGEDCKALLMLIDGGEYK